MKLKTDYYELTELLNRNYSDRELRDHVEAMYDNKIRILVDATYLFHARPGNIVTFKEAFNAQKNRHLTKLHIYSSSNGWIFKVRKVRREIKIFNFSEHGALENKLDSKYINHG